MTRTQAIATITTRLEEADDVTLAAAAAHLSMINGKPLTVGDVLEAFPTDSILPRDLTAAELEFIAQSKEDFRLGRTRSLAESRAYVDAELSRRRLQRTAP
jgi:hypothetical protein